ncbi:hypothetical protein HZA39_01130 [Candidatus Peregrinibacteria bacterium]|nr:hypothetical protein [Candidatus Peregrinibacteria bacterium]
MIKRSIVLTVVLAVIVIGVGIVFAAKYGGDFKGSFLTPTPKSEQPTNPPDSSTGYGAPAAYNVYISVHITNATSPSNRYINMYKVEAISKDKTYNIYKGTLIETKMVSSEMGKSSTTIFTVKGGEAVNFVAFKAAQNAKNIKTWFFTNPPYKNFFIIDGISKRLCKTNYSDFKTKKITGYSDYGIIEECMDADGAAGGSIGIKAVDEED